MLRRLPPALLLLGLAACGGSGGGSGPAITAELVPGGALAVGAPAATATVRSAAATNDGLRLELGNLPPLGPGGDYELWAVDLIAGFSRVNTFISCGRFDTEVTTAPAFTGLPPGAALVAGSQGRAADFSQQAANDSQVAAALPVDLANVDALWVSVELAGDADTVPGGASGVAPLLAATLDPADPTAPVSLTFPVDLSQAHLSLRIPVDAEGNPSGRVEVALSGLPSLAQAGIAFTYELWLQDGQGGRASLGRFDVDPESGAPTPDVFAQLATVPLAAGDSLLISVEPADDPAPDTLFPFLPASGAIRMP
ncbi:MAG: hypothetical protein D6739_07320 [Nitrospirae bacterium]|nr:MAG: hypothetical protein D6739_07320 [Nitrospirota bacterium]